MDSKPRRPQGVHSALSSTAAIAIAAALFYFGTGFTPQPVLTWFAPLPVLVLASRTSARSAAAAAFAAFFLGTANNWSFYLDSHDLPLPAAMAINVGCSAIFTLAVVLYRGLIRRGRGLLAVIAIPALWTSAMYLVQIVNPMGLIEPFATAQGDVPLVLQVASVTGGAGVTFVLLLVPAAIAAITAGGVGAGVRWRIGAITAVVMGMVLGGGAWRMAADTGPVTSVALIANNHSPWGVDVSTDEGERLLNGYLDQIAALPRDVAIAVLPEGAFSGDEAGLQDLVTPMREAAREHGITIVVGMVFHPHGGIEQNALTFPPTGAEPVTYRKHHDRSPQIPGTALVFPFGDGTDIGVEICGDLTHIDPSRDYGAAGARFMLIPASTEGDNGWQLSRVALLRGVENGFSIVWSSRLGELTAADGMGRVLGDGHTGGAKAFTTVTAEVPDGPGVTVYTRLGDWFAWLCAIAAIAGIAATHPRAAHGAFGSRRVGPESAVVGSAAVSP